MRKLLRDLVRAWQNMFHMPPAEVLAQRELEEAKRSLLEMQTARDYSSRMVEYNLDRIRRLAAYINKANEVKPAEPKGEDK